MPLYGVQRHEYGDEWVWLDARAEPTSHIFASLTISRREARAAVTRLEKNNPAMRFRTRRYYRRF